MLFAGGGVAHQEVCSENWQLKPSILRHNDDLDENGTLDIGTDQVLDGDARSLAVPETSSTAPKSRGSGLVVRLPPLSSFPRLTMTDKDRMLVPDDEETASDWEYESNNDSTNDCDLVLE